MEKIKEPRHKCVDETQGVYSLEGKSPLWDVSPAPGTSQCGIGGGVDTLQVSLRHDAVRICQGQKAVVMNTGQPVNLFSCPW